MAALSILLRLHLIFKSLPYFFLFSCIYAFTVNQSFRVSHNVIKSVFDTNFIT